MKKHMKTNFLNLHGKFFLGFIISLLSIFNEGVLANEVTSPTFSGAAWVGLGDLFHSSDTINDKQLSGRILHTFGALIEIKSELTSKINGEVGLGVAAGHTLATRPSSYGGYAPMSVGPFISKAALTYSLFNTGESNSFFRAGYFPFVYNSLAQDFGQYLYRGPVYPGLLISGNSGRDGQPVNNLVGFQGHYEWRGFRQDLLITSELEFYPYFDISPSYVGSYGIGKAFRIGAGINFYHLIAIDDSLTNDRKVLYVDTPSIGVLDSVTMPFRGIKVMAQAELDPKILFNLESPFSSEDLKLYFEVAVLGLNNDRVHKKVYGDIIHRMPIMGGFNLPAFGIVDRLSIEAEWYGAYFPDDLKRFNHTRGNVPSSLPPENDGNLQVHRDDWKWSLNADKSWGHVSLKGQLANDHFRPGIYTGDGDNSPPGSESVTITPTDFYGMLTLAWHF